MAHIIPFRAIRPPKEKVAQVTSRSYQEYSEEELNNILAENPYSFLHILTPAYRAANRITVSNKFNLVHEGYEEFLRRNLLLKDSEKSLYIYKMQRGNYSCCGILCAVSAKDYQNDIIKKHEATIERREQLFANYLKIVKFEAEPVLMTYKSNTEIDHLFRETMKKEPEYLFSTPDKIKHTMWKESDEDIIESYQRAFAQINALYIADGHHRSASSNLLSKMAEANNPNHQGSEPYNYFMSYLIPERDIKIYEFNRIVKDLNDLSTLEFLGKLEAKYEIQKLGSEFNAALQKHEFSMYLDGNYYLLKLKKQAYTFTDALSKLDTQLLYTTILEPILGITDLRNDKRIQYGYGKNNLIQMKTAIDKGEYAVGFSMLPTMMDEVKSIADAGLVMPPKSTYIEPKLRSGLTIYEL